jgi:mannose-6-phosphate isomerase-like protein (cupin superfamily)
MTYPKARYQGDGEASALITPGNADPDLIRTSGTRVHYVATGDDTDGLFGLYRWSMGPSSGGADPHFHRTISESFYVLTGNIRLFDGSEWSDATPGDFMYVPPGGVHGFDNLSGEPASMLILFAPGAPREEYFEGLNDLGQMSEDERLEFFVAHDNLFVAE